MNKQLEEFKNRALAKLLTENGVAAEFEQRRGRKRMDVVADVEGLRFALEAETERVEAKLPELLDNWEGMCRMDKAVER